MRPEYTSILHRWTRYTHLPASIIGLKPPGTQHHDNVSIPGRHAEVNLEVQLLVHRGVEGSRRGRRHHRHDLGVRGSPRVGNRHIADEIEPTSGAGAR